MYHIICPQDPALSYAEVSVFFNTPTCNDEDIITHSFQVYRMT